MVSGAHNTQEGEGKSACWTRCAYLLTCCLPQQTRRDLTAGGAGACIRQRLTRTHAHGQRAFRTPKRFHKTETLKEVTVNSNLQTADAAAHNRAARSGMVCSALALALLRQLTAEEVLSGIGACGVVVKCKWNESGRAKID
jgi:hypothetical protein